MILKRIFDFFAAAIGLVLLFPFLLLIALLIKIKTTGSVMFIQKRVGRNAKPFKMIKFCTMTPIHCGSTITVRGENRITPLGAVLRKYKLDELPELWNVLIGDMSLVGPRPDVPGYADKLQGEDRKILELRPGITGPASLKYADEEAILAKQADPQKYNDKVIFPDKVRINLNYMQNRSFWLDIKIIFHTILGKKLSEDYLR